MPLANLIDDFEFFDLQGAIVYRQEQLEIFERAGVNGSGIRRLGQRGEPFELVSVQFHEDFAAALAALQDYGDLAGTDPVELVRNGESHGDYLVLNVKEIATEAVSTICADGVDPTYQIRQTVRWRLLG